MSPGFNSRVWDDQMSEKKSPLEGLKLTRENLEKTVLRLSIHREVAPQEEVYSCPNYIRGRSEGGGNGLIGSRWISPECSLDMTFNRRCHVNCPRPDPQKELTRRITNIDDQISNIRARAKAEIDQLKKQKKGLVSLDEEVKKRDGI